MRSIRALIAAVLILASYPAAIVVELLLGAGGATLIHFVAGAGFVLFATSVFDFRLPRWVNLLGAAAAGLFGAIFLLQGVADVTRLEGLRVVAFEVLGQLPERLLPDVMYVWFIALALGASWGWTRFLGWAVMLVVILIEIATLVTLLLDVPMVNVRVTILLPFVWLIFESAKRQRTEYESPPREPAVAGTGPDA